MFVDSRNQLVYDPAECFALKMGSATLRACVGDGVDLLGIPELRRLTKQPEGKRKRHKGARKVSIAVQRERKGMGQGKKPFTSASSRPTGRVVLDEEWMLIKLDPLRLVEHARVQHSIQHDLAQLSEHYQVSLC